MRNTLLAAAVVAAMLAACGGQSTQPRADEAAAEQREPTAADAEFAALAEDWLDGAMRLQPVYATQVGDHRFDDQLGDLGPAGRKAFGDFTRSRLVALDAIDHEKLSDANRIDAALLRNQLEYDLWTLETLQSWAWDPQQYSQLAGGALYGLMAREFAPLPERLAAATARMEQIPGLFAQMRDNLDPARVPRIHAETVARQNAGILSIVDGLVMPHAGALDDAGRERLDAAVAGLRTAVAEHQQWLDDTLVPNAAGDFRIGAELYDAKLAFALDSPLTRQEIRTRAEAAIAETRAEMYAIARGVLEGREGAPEAPEAPTDAQQQAVIEAALELAYADRPARADVMQVAKDATVQATAFVRGKDLVTVPDTPVEIITMPEFQRGVALAYCDSPGPLDKDLATFYAVSPIPDDWTEEQVDSFLREYNTRSIHELSIHEAMPGHYLQLWHSNKYPSTLRAVLGSGPFIEGWGMYAERVMADAGYMDGDPLMQLIQRKWALRAMANAIIDQAIHVDGMTREQAMELMTVTTFQQEREAAGKWVRAQLTSAQLPTYFVGYSEHMDLRRAMEAKLGEAFDLKAYHDEVLSYGSPAVRYVRQLMLDEEDAG